ncbi:MAG: glycosyltransferase family 4 protein [Myxococcota bacterium]
MRVLFVSKAVEAPWNDSSKNLVRDVSQGLTRYTPTTMVSRDGGPGTLPVYAGKSRFAPGLAAQVRVMAALLRDRRHALWHFFFAPNPKTGLAGRAATALRRRPSVHTVCSLPTRHAASFFATRTVVLSQRTERLLQSWGQPCVRIPPALTPPAAPTEAERKSAREAFGLTSGRPIVVYAGDLEFGGGAETVVRAFQDDVQLVMACRRKTAQADAEAARLKALAHPSARWVGETPSIHALLGAADAVVLPATTTYAKMDYPLVLLEAMAMKRPTVVTAGTAAEELTDGGAIASAPGPGALREATRRALQDGPRESFRAYVCERFSPTAVAAAYEALYDELLP